jgi:signal transduction histidine kinase
MTRLRTFLASMAGRLFVILLLGMGVAAIVATLLANTRRQQEFERQQVVRSADRLQGFVQLLDANVELRDRLLGAGAGVRRAPEQVRVQGVDAELTAVLAQRSGPLASASVQMASMGTCLAELRQLLPPSTRPRGEHRRPRDPDFLPPRCRLVSLTLSDGTPLRLAVESPALARERAAALDPWFLSLLLLAIAVLAYVVARIASTPLQGLAVAAAALGHDLQRAPVAVTGPTEVRRAAEAFNAMQLRLQRHLSERTQMLAAITHDLQTPLTRLRLRLENVDDAALRERLIADLAAMQALIGEGLELARSAESREQAVPLDLDSLLESLVADASDAGADVRFGAGCGLVLPLRPLAMQRVFSNLIDNAIKYAGDVEVSAQRRGDGLCVCIRDHGPGIPEDALDSVLEPFVRLETSRSRLTGGAGLGLAIARVLAEKDGASLQLRNHPQGGLEAQVLWERLPGGD